MAENTSSTTTLQQVLQFLNSPAGQAIMAAVPELVTDVIKILHKSGALTAQDIADHFSIDVPEVVTPPK